MYFYECFWVWLGQLKLSHVIIILSALLFGAPLIIHLSQTSVSTELRDLRIEVRLLQEPVTTSATADSVKDATTSDAADSVEVQPANARADSVKVANASIVADRMQVAIANATANSVKMATVNVMANSVKTKTLDVMADSVKATIANIMAENVKVTTANTTADSVKVVTANDKVVNVNVKTLPANATANSVKAATVNATADNVKVATVSATADSVKVETANATDDNVKVVTTNATVDLAVATANTEADRVKMKYARAAAELARLRASVDQARLDQIEAIRRDTPDIAPPRQILPLHPPSAVPPVSFNLEPHCRMYSCFDHSRCSLTSGFPVYLYDPDVYVPLAGAEIYGFLKQTLRQMIKYNVHYTNYTHEACIYVVLVGEAFSLDKASPSTTNSFKLLFNESAVKALPYWGGDGRNHMLLNFARGGLSVGSGDAFRGVSTGRAMIAQSTFTHMQYRPGFDIVIPPALGPPAGDVWVDCVPIAPARRKYLLSFQGSQPPAVGDNLDPDKTLIEYLQKVESAAPASDKFLLQFECDPSVERQMVLPIGDWVLCGTDISRRAVLRESTFALLLAPSDRNYATTALLQARLYEALRSGAIPVILGGDRTRLPFEEVLDWRRAVLALPKARVTEMHFLLRALSDADLLAFRRQGRLLWEKYLSSLQASVDTLLAVIRTRLNIPPRPAPSATGLPAFNGSFYVPRIKPLDVDMKQKVPLGLPEAPCPSPAYKRNYSISLLQGYELWNDWGDPFSLYPQLPWDPTVTSEARFLGSTAGFRPVGKGAGGAGREFRKALGGDRPREQYTIVILTYEREAVLTETLARLSGLPYLHKVVVVWNGATGPSSSRSWPEVGAPVAVVKTTKNSLNNRFLPFHLIETEAVLCFDDDAYIGHDEIVFAFRVWREQRDNIVGFPGRYHAWDLNFNDGFLYNGNFSCELSMVLTGAAFIHRYYMWAYWKVLPNAIRDYVDKIMNCEDIAMNFLVSHLTRKPPVKVTSRWTFRHPNVPVTLSTKKRHYSERHKCIKFFSQVMGYTPLLTTQYRADSVLYNTPLPRYKQRCFQLV